MCDFSFLFFSFILGANYFPLNLAPMSSKVNQHHTQHHPTSAMSKIERKEREEETRALHAQDLAKISSSSLSPLLHSPGR
jgi:hypothetical protein